MSAVNGLYDHHDVEVRRINVAILGLGRIAHKMAQTLNAMSRDYRYLDLINPYAVASRDEEKARTFASEYAITRHYGSYEALLKDPAVDLVYIATPHSLHAQQAIECMNHGKHVLVEKSFTANSEQAQQVIEVSRKTGLLCAEAIWTRYMPWRSEIEQVITSGQIGEVKVVQADLGYPMMHKDRLVDPHLAGGALLDVGVYPLNFIDMVMGGELPEKIVSCAKFTSTGVDEHNMTTLWFNDAMGVATSSMNALSPRAAQVWGTQGYLTCDNVNNPDHIDVYNINHERIRRIATPSQLTGFEYEVCAAAQAILNAKIECDQASHKDTMRIMELMDAIRAQWEFTFPFEK